MHSENSILMKAPLKKIFQTASDLSLWPKILPHYRYITYLDKSEKKNIVTMAAWRIIPKIGGMRIPVKWTSEQEIDHEKIEIRFHHLRAFTKGMRVVWTFRETAQGVYVRIVHDLNSEIPVIGKKLIEPIVGGFFIHFIANQTLMHMKTFVEKSNGT